MTSRPPLSDFDRLLTSLDHGLRTVFAKPAAARPAPRPVPAAQTDGTTCETLGLPRLPPAPAMPILLTDAQAQLSGALMRINHVGEICAQALYQSQSLVTRNPALREHFAHAAQEELDHLAWTHQRVTELGTHTSYLTPIWYAGAFSLGCLAGLVSDRISLGFVVETERQVEQHLATHLDRLPAEDLNSKAIVAQMKLEEARHAEEALSAGAQPMPAFVKLAMRLAAKVMTRTAHYI
ncbi:2-polyprenyl-3-methyl-6-methoxy-1,4-benzoquinone monooxygenase [Roseateles sp. GG27B]